MDDGPPPNDQRDLTRLVDALPGVVFISSVEEGWPFTYLSAGAQELFGYPSASLLGPLANWERTVHPDDLAGLLETIRQAIAKGGRYMHEYRILTPEGEERWVCERGAAYATTHDRPGCLEGFITDISLQKKTEAALRSSRRKYKSIFENSVEGIFQSRPDGSYIAINPTLARIYGYDSAAEMMSSVTDISHQLYVDPRRREEFADQIARYNVVTKFESEIRRKDGKVIWISENARLVRTPAGEPDYYEGTVADITRRKRAELKLAYEQNMLRTLIDNWPDIIYVKDGMGRYILSNLAHTRLLGMDSPQEIEGRTAADFFIEKRAREFVSEDAGVMSSGTPILNREEIRQHPVSGTPVILLTTKLPMRDAHGQIIGLVCISRDMTKHRQLEEQLRQSQKMEAIGSLAGGIAHDFNNLLTAILGYSEWLMHRGDPDTVRDAGEIHSAATRAATLTQQLLAFSRKQLIQPKVIDLNVVIRDIEKLLGRLLNETVSLICRPTNEPLCICSDVGQIEQVLVNMVVNARDALPHGGTIVVETIQTHINENQATPDLPDGDYVKLSVGDNGSGIPLGIQGRIFDPFFTTKDQGKGTGLGLATCYGIIKQNGGHIHFQSELNVGTIFDIYLPMATSLAARKATQPANTQLPRGEETILLVEDDPDVLKFTSGLLVDLGYKVIEAGNGHEALEVANSMSDQSIDLLLTDVVMPLIGGKPLADRFAEIYPETKVLFTSGYNEDALLQAGIAEKQVMFLAKPYSPTVVAQKLREVFASK